MAYPHPHTNGHDDVSDIKSSVVNVRMLGVCGSQRDCLHYFYRLQQQKKIQKQNKKKVVGKKEKSLQ